MAPYDGGHGPHLPPGKRWRGYASEKAGVKTSATQPRPSQPHSASQKQTTVILRTNLKLKKVAVRKSCGDEKKECQGQEHDCECEPSWKKHLRLDTPWAEDAKNDTRNTTSCMEHQDPMPIEPDTTGTDAWEWKRIDTQLLASASDTNHVRDVAWSDLRIFGRIGTGAYADVLGGTFRGKKVAVKRFRTTNDDPNDRTMDARGTSEQLITTGNVWSKMRDEASRLVRYRHPNICKIVGMCQSPPALILELAERGSLRDFLRRHGKLPSRMQWKFARDIANAMKHLHEMQPPLIHRDLTSSNILITKYFQAKVADLGMATTGNATGLEEAGSFGAVPWMAPEVLRDTEAQDEKCDVFSFGVIVWELATGLMPWSEMNPFRVMVAVAREGARLPIPEDCPSWMKQVMRSCWQEAPADRPDFDTLTVHLETATCA